MVLKGCQMAIIFISKSDQILKIFLQIINNLLI